MGQRNQVACRWASGQAKRLAFGLFDPLPEPREVGNYQWRIASLATPRVDI